ncbi:MAG: phospho-sugar mutase [Acidimicrobiales bacterium]
MNKALLAEVMLWIASDPDAKDRAELERLLEVDDEEELKTRFSSPLHFGTAGLRGPEIAGPSGMNRATVSRATQGVVHWLEATGVDASRGVVVGRDARHGSEKFNDEVIGVLLGANVKVYEMPAPMPTPLVPYVVKHLGLAAGIMITASHNPPRDNGYKLYDQSGSQIIAPSDEIVERYMASASVVTHATRSSDWHAYVDPDVLDSYKRHMVERFGVATSRLSITYTPLHGVGGALMTEMLAEAGYTDVAVVDAQFAPDGDFPTLAFPNPEEPGALDLALAKADAANSTLVIANDPDADRLGAAVRDGAGWRVLRGDEIGWLLASSLLDGAGPDDVVATSIVSSTLLEAMAKEAKVRYAVTLTGFKWISRAAGAGRLRFGYEEALGFAVDPLVADKDGMSAALALCRLAHELELEGKTLLDRLDEIEGHFGVHAGAQLSLRADGPEGLTRITRKVDALRATPPASLGGLAVTRVVDLTQGAFGLAPTEGVYFELGEHGRVVVRPSGTEAKLKAYVEVTTNPDSPVTLDQQRDDAAATLGRVRDDLGTLLAF